MFPSDSGAPDAQSLSFAPPVNGTSAEPGSGPGPSLTLTHTLSEARLANLASYPVPPAQAALATASTFKRNDIARILGGHPQTMCVSTGGRNLLFPTLSMNPWLPSAPGAPGLLLRASAGRQWKGDVQTVFVGLAGGQCAYMGEYELAFGGLVDVREYQAFGDKVRRCAHARVCLLAELNSFQ